MCVWSSQSWEHNLDNKPDADFDHGSWMLLPKMEKKYTVSICY